jgi:hypothetical protein
VAATFFIVAAAFFFGSFLVQFYAQEGGNDLARFLRFLCIVALLMGTWFSF